HRIEQIAFQFDQLLEVARTGGIDVNLAGSPAPVPLPSGKTSHFPTQDDGFSALGEPVGGTVIEPLEIRTVAGHGVQPPRLTVRLAVVAGKQNTALLPT